jgi:hypothetical protein
VTVRRRHSAAVVAVGPIEVADALAA